MAAQHRFVAEGVGEHGVGRAFKFKHTLQDVDGCGQSG